MGAQQPGNAMKPLTHSYSSIKDFEGCAKRYHEVRILRKFKSQDTDATRYGTAVHLAFEERVRDKKPLPQEFDRFEGYVKPILTLSEQDGAELFCERKMAITADFQACEFFDPRVWFRGIPDVLLVNRDKGVARVVDYKTGKSSRFADTAQLELLAAMTFLHHPEVQTVRGLLLFVVAGDAVPAEFTRGQLPEILSKWVGKADRIETARESGVWNPSPSGLCRFCPVTGTECPHSHK